MLFESTMNNLKTKIFSEFMLKAYLIFLVIAYQKEEYSFKKRWWGACFQASERGNVIKSLVLYKAVDFDYGESLGKAEVALHEIKHKENNGFKTDLVVYPLLGIRIRF